MRSASAARLANDAILDPQLLLTTSADSDRPGGGRGTVLLTGATGNLGRYLCAELLRRTTAQVYCLVRSNSSESADERLRQTLNAVGVSPSDLNRVRAVPGDLARPLLGLSADTFAALARQIDDIFHCGADVRLGGAYSRLHPVNVSATVEVARLAMSGCPSRLHHVSTLSVFLAARAHDRDVVSERDEPELRFAGQVGYAQTKAVAERLLRQARERGVPVTVYRLPLLIAHSRTGACGANDYLAALIRACVQMGTAPDGDLGIPVCSIDHAAAAIVSLACLPPPPNSDFHVLDGRPLTMARLVARTRHAGYRLADVPIRRWRELVTDHRRHPEVRAMWALEAVSEHLLPTSAHAALPELDSTLTHQALAGLGLDTTPVNDAVLDRMLTHLRKLRHLPHPQHH